MTAFTGIDQIDALLADTDETSDEHGGATRHVFLRAERYLFDFQLDSRQWAQFDTTSDGWYFGIWIHKAERKILSYIEGDIYFTQCADAESYDRRVAQLCEDFEPSAAYVVIQDGQRTDYYQDRSELFVDPERFPGSQPDGVD